jgi:hypothetical protein
MASDIAPLGTSDRFRLGIDAATFCIFWCVNLLGIGVITAL